jgi:zinc and cadmium transporter
MLFHLFAIAQHIALYKCFWQQIAVTHINTNHAQPGMAAALYAIISVIIVSLIAVFMAIPLLLKKKISHCTLLTLLSLSVGTLLGSVFIHFLPEALESSHESGHTLEVALFVLLGFITFFILEKLIHWRHTHSKKKYKGKEVHSHAYHLAPLNLIGDGIHNFLDGLVIAAGYVISIPLGLAATISVLFHEIPQEIADFGILLYSGMSRFKALLFNLLAAATAIIGTILGLILAGSIEGFTQFIIPFAAGNFIYIAASNLVPELHQRCRFWHTVLHICAIIVGIGIMALLALLAPAHSY